MSYSTEHISGIFTNSKIILAFLILIVFGAVVEIYMLQARGNPLPNPDEIKMVSFIPACAQDKTQAESLDMGLYRELHACLNGSERLVYSGTGELAGTIIIRQTDGSTSRTKIYRWGLVQTEDGLFANTDGAKTNRLCSVIRRLPLARRGFR